MANPFFRFKQFTVHHDRCAMKVTTDACLFGAFVALDSVKHTGRALDIGAGTGLLSLMVAQEQDVVIDAVEIDDEAAKQAKENVAASPWSGRISICRESIESFPGTGYDLIFSNPPFYETDLRSGDPKKNLAHHSTELKLETLVRIAVQKLKPGGVFFLLLPARRAAEAAQELARQGFFIHEELRVRQTPAHGIFRVLLKCGLEQAAPATRELTIMGEDGRYTEAFTHYLRSYYLYL